MVSTGTEFYRKNVPFVFRTNLRVSNNLTKYKCFTIMVLSAVRGFPNSKEKINNNVLEFKVLSKEK